MKTLSLIAALIFTAMLVMGCSSTSQDMFGGNNSERGIWDRPEAPRHDPELKARLSRVAAPIMRANADACASTRTIDFADEPVFEICSTKVTIIYTAVINAHTDGNKILVTSGLMGATNDDELAFIVAHELAHNIAGHKISEGSFKALELEADGIAVRLMTRAGYSPYGVAAMLTRLDIGSDAPSKTHPLRRERVAAIEAAISRLP